MLNLYTWPDYLAPDTIATFEKQTGIKVRVSYFDTNEMLEGRMLTGSSGFDVVVPTAPYLQRQIRSGAYLPLDKRKLPNIANLDPAIMSRVALNDPGNVHGVVYAWGTYGLGYNEKRVAEALPNIAVDSWRLVFDPEAAHFVAERSVHPTQRSQWRSDGRLDVEMRVPVCPPVVTWVLGFGSAVEVRGPVELARRVAREHTRAATRVDSSRARSGGAVDRAHAPLAIAGAADG